MGLLPLSRHHTPVFPEVSLSSHLIPNIIDFQMSAALGAQKLHSLLFVSFREEDLKSRRAQKAIWVMANVILLALKSLSPFPWKKKDKNVLMRRIIIIALHTLQNRVALPSWSFLSCPEFIYFLLQSLNYQLCDFWSGLLAGGTPWLHPSARVKISEGGTPGALEYICAPKRENWASGR